MWQKCLMRGVTSCPHAMSNTVIFANIRTIILGPIILFKIIQQKFKMKKYLMLIKELFNTLFHSFILF